MDNVYIDRILASSSLIPHIHPFQLWPIHLQALLGQVNEIQRLDLTLQLMNRIIVVLSCILRE